MGVPNFANVSQHPQDLPSATMREEPREALTPHTVPRNRPSWAVLEVIYRPRHHSLEYHDSTSHRGSVGALVLRLSVFPHRQATLQPVLRALRLKSIRRHGQRIHLYQILHRTGRERTLQPLSGGTRTMERNPPQEQFHARPIPIQVRHLLHIPDWPNNAPCRPTSRLRWCCPHNPRLLPSTPR